MSLRYSDKPWVKSYDQGVPASEFSTGSMP